MPLKGVYSYVTDPIPVSRPWRLCNGKTQETKTEEKRVCQGFKGSQLAVVGVGGEEGDFDGAERKPGRSSGVPSKDPLPEFRVIECKRLGDLRSDLDLWLRRKEVGTSLVVQWSRLCTSTARGTGSTLVRELISHIPCIPTKINK